MKFKIFLAFVVSFSIYFSLLGMTEGDTSALILTIYGTIIVVFLKKILDVLIEMKNTHKGN